MSAAPLDVSLATQVGADYDAATIARDLRKLWSTGRFRDIRVEIKEDANAADVVFHVTVEPQFPLHEVRFSPHSFGLQISLPPGAVVSQPRADDLALAAQRQLGERGFANAKVTALLQALPNGRADVVLEIAAGEALRLQPLGDSSLRAPRWYTPSAVAGHAARLQAHWVAKGYFDAKVTPETVSIGPRRAVVSFRVDPGAFYRPLDTKTLCSCLFDERRDAERAGVLDFQAAVDEEGRYSIERGASYRVGRIQFFGHPHYSDAAIRSHFLLDEGASFDLWMLRRSLQRLNSSGMFEPVDEHQVRIATDAQSGSANVTVRLTERKRGVWNFGGPFPFSGSISARLPPWGKGILELSTYTASLNLLAYSSILKLAANRRLLPVVAIERPFTPGAGWLSGFAFAPQNGLRWTGINYAANQLQERLSSWLAAPRAPDLPVTMQRPWGETAVLCTAPKPKLRVPRQAAIAALQFVRTLTY